MLVTFLYVQHSLGLSLVSGVIHFVGLIVGWSVIVFRSCDFIYVARVAFFALGLVVEGSQSGFFWILLCVAAAQFKHFS